MPTWVCPTCTETRNPWDRSPSGLCWGCHFKPEMQQKRRTMRLRPPKWPIMSEGQLRRVKLPDSAKAQKYMTAYQHPFSQIFREKPLKLRELDYEMSRSS